MPTPAPFRSQIEALLQPVTQAGSFAAQGAVALPVGRITIDGFGLLPLPITTATATALAAIAAPAPFGRGTETIHDATYRSCLQIDGAAVQIQDPHWLRVLATVKHAALEGLGVDAQTHAYERLYRLAALVLWPATHDNAVLMQAGNSAALNWLAAHVLADDLAERCERIVGLLLRDWPLNVRYASAADREQRTQLLESIWLLGGGELLVRYLRTIPANGLLATEEVSAVVQALQKQPEALLAEVVTGAVGRCNRDVIDVALSLFVSLATARPQLGWQRPCYAAVADRIMAAAEQPGWQQPSTSTLARMLVLWLQAPPLPGSDNPSPGDDAPTNDAATNDAPTNDEAAASQPLLKLFIGPQAQWPWDTVALTAATALLNAAAPHQQLGTKARWLVEAVKDRLRARAGQKPQPPADARRDPGERRCQCKDCLALEAFGRDPVKFGWLFKAAQRRRRHVEQQNACRDLRFHTVRQGSPHGLEAEKTVDFASSSP